MIKAVRLLEPNKQKGWNLKRFMSPSGTLYQAGRFGIPSSLVIVRDDAEVKYLLSVSAQFDVVEVSDREQLSELVQNEMESRVREQGAAAVRASVQDVAPSKAKVEELYDVTTPTLTPTITSLPATKDPEDSGDSTAAAGEYNSKSSRPGKKPRRRS